MHTKIQKWGNSQGLRLAKSLLADAQLGVGDEVEISVKDGTIIIRPTQKIRGRHSLEELVKRIPKNYLPSKVDWGYPTAKEGW